MTKIVALLMVYNSADTIVRCLMSLDGRVDEIYCFDGRWEGFPYPSDYSDDGTDKLIQEFARTSKSVITYIRLPVMHQHEARTVALGYVKMDDWILVMDSDEFVKIWDEEQIHQIMESGELGFKICYRYPMPISAVTPPRFWRKTSYVHYSTDHRRVFDVGGEIDAVHFKPTTAIVVDHQDVAEKKRMRPYMETYKKWLYEYERSH